MHELNSIVFVTFIALADLMFELCLALERFGCLISRQNQKQWPMKGQPFSLKDSSILESKYYYTRRMTYICSFAVLRRVFLKETFTDHVLWWYRFEQGIVEAWKQHSILHKHIWLSVFTSSHALHTISLLKASCLHERLDVKFVGSESMRGQPFLGGHKTTDIQVPPVKEPY